jgi:hypothetical protein
MTAQSKQRTIECVWGTPCGKMVWGRLDRGEGVSALWIQTSPNRLRTLVDATVETSGRCRTVENCLDGDLPADVSEVDWRELSVDLHVRTPLTEREADVYVLHQRFGLNRSEIAAELSISPNTVDNHLQRVRNIESEMTQLVVDTVESLGLVQDVAETIADIEYVGD